MNTIIIWNKATWYSKLIAGILFVLLPILGFYLGVQYEKKITKLEFEIYLQRQKQLLSPAYWKYIGITETGEPTVLQE